MQNAPVIYWYARVWTNGQSVAAQDAALRKHGWAKLLTDAKAEAHRPTGAGRNARRTRAQLRRGKEHDFADVTTRPVQEI